MKNLLNVLVNALKARILPLWTKLKYLTNLSFLKSRVLLRITSFLTGILQVKPRNKDDYYPVFRWLVSKRLAHSFVIITGLLCLCYFTMVNPISNVVESMRSGEKIYSYSAIPLRFVDGKVKIKAKSGYVAYEGSVKDGYANGQGTLYDENGTIVYQGNFSRNKYSGEGTLYYPEGQVEYKGSFEENQFEGDGTLYRENGTKEYSGEFSSGVFEGNGTLYNASEREAFLGEFHNGEIVYAQFLEKTPAEIAQMYKGSLKLYQSETQSVVVMSDIDVYYMTDNQNDSMESEAKTSAVYVQKDTFRYGDKEYTSIEEIMTVLGSPVFEGNSYVTLPEAVGIDTQKKEGADIPIEADLVTTQEFDEVWTVDAYAGDALLYLYAFTKDDITYTFFAADRGEDFFMYEIER